jgi:hypothetical protein
VQFAAVTSITNPRLFAYYRVAGPSEPITYTWGLSSVTNSSGGIARYDGVDTAAPLDGTVSTASSSAAVTSLSVPEVTTSTQGAMLIGGIAINASPTSVTIASPAGMNERWDLAGKRQQFDDQLQPTAAPSGTRQWTYSSAREAAAWLAALRPAQ